jgi:hypothetical protein
MGDEPKQGTVVADREGRLISKALPEDPDS